VLSNPSYRVRARAGYVPNPGVSTMNR
jgi:hypothetical protein